MARFQSLLSYITLSLVASAYAAVVPVADLVLTNAQVSPDGFPRDAVVVNGAMPAPLITGQKVSETLTVVQPAGLHHFLR